MKQKRYKMVAKMGDKNYGLTSKYEELKDSPWQYVYWENNKKVIVSEREYFMNHEKYILKLGIGKRINKKTNKETDEDGYSYGGYDKDGYDKDGFNRYGYDRDGYDKDGYDKYDFDRNGINKDTKRKVDSEGHTRDYYN